MCGIWDWQSTIVKDLIDSQDLKHTLFCRKIVFVAIYAFFSDNKCPLFTRLGVRGGRSPKADIVRFFYRFFIGRLPLMVLWNADLGVKRPRGGDRLWNDFGKLFYPQYSFFRFLSLRLLSGECAGLGWVADGLLLSTQNMLNQVLVTRWKADLLQRKLAFNFGNSSKVCTNI